MVKFILKRLGISILVIFLISTFAFSLVRMLPGDPVVLALGAEASEEDLQRLRVEYNLDKPVMTQYILWITGILHGDFGKSITLRREAGLIMQERLPVTVSIGLPALVLSSIFGVLFGIICAIKRNKFIDKLITIFSTIGIGTPIFWIGILSIYLFAMVLKILPIQGYTSPSVDFGQYAIKAIMPVFSLSLGLIATISRQTRSNMLEIINQDFIRTARANGLAEKSIVFRHSLKNAMIPVITVIALRIRIVIGGSVLVEQIFNIPGIGTLLRTAINGRDYSVVQACIFLISLVTVFFNLIVDILYGVVDPRIRKARL